MACNCRTNSKSLRIWSIFSGEKRGERSQVISSSAVKEKVTINNGNHRWKAETSPIEFDFPILKMLIFSMFLYPMMCPKSRARPQSLSLFFETSALLFCIGRHCFQFRVDLKDPKPQVGGLTADTQKISVVELFAPFVGAQSRLVYLYDNVLLGHWLAQLAEVPEAVIQRSYKPRGKEKWNTSNVLSGYNFPPGS